MPEPDADADKEDRGRVLVIAGSRETPGAAVLAATAALRAGAGKLAVATPESAHAIVAAALPEARVIALPESREGGLRDEGVKLLVERIHATHAVLMGPGLLGCDATAGFVNALLPHVRHGVTVLDAAALDVVAVLERFDQPVILTPHAGEMAHVAGCAKEDVRANAQEMALKQARAWNATVALKGAVTWIARPDGRLWRHDGHTPGLAMSGSGDVLAGVIAGLAARGADAAQAAVWGVALHARAGEALAQEAGTVGYLARELATRVPAMLERLAAPGRP
nr:NAD(P)H-hydrate dehydratase [Ramlibacter albus]